MNYKSLWERAVYSGLLVRVVGLLGGVANGKFGYWLVRQGWHVAIVTPIILGICFAIAFGVAWANEKLAQRIRDRRRRESSFDS